jgi:hypothetical protein
MIVPTTTAPTVVALAFWHPWLLSFLALASIPVIIHLLHRRRFRTVMWAAMEFLLRSDKETARRLRIIQLLLLLTRVAIILFIVGALARPLLTGAFFAGFLGQSRSASTVILDNSYSMALQQGNTTAFDSAKEVADAVASTLRKGDSLSLMTISPTWSFASESARDPELLRRQIRAAELSHGGTDVLSALTKCLEQMKETQQSHREIFIVSDCRREGWRVEDTAGWRRVARLIEQCDPKPKVFIIDVSAPGAGQNTFIESVRLPSAPPGVGRGYSVECTIRTKLDEPGPPPIVTLYLDDEDREAGRVKGSEFKDGVSTAKFVFRPTEPGWHWGKVAIGPDALGPDNVRYFAYEVSETLRVLCLDGSPSSRPLESSMGFLRIALAPDKADSSASHDAEESGDVSPGETSASATMSGSATNIIWPVVAPLSRFWDFDVNDYPAIFITDAPGFSDRVAASLRSYVYSGGGLVVFLGDAARPDRYAPLTDAAGGRPLLPAQVTGHKGSAVAYDSPETPEAVRLAEFDFNHPIVRPFEVAKDGDLTAASFYRYATVAVDENDPDVRVLMRFDNGDPYLLERRFGRGVVLLFTASPDLRWSNLPLKPVFLPLVHRTTYWLARRGSAAHELAAGEPIRAPVPSRLASAEITLDRPRGGSAVVRPVLAGIPGEKGGTKLPTVVYNGTDPAGIYALRVPRDEADAEPPVETLFSVNVETRESDLAPVSPKVLESLFKPAQVKYLKTGDDVLGPIRTSRHGREVWRYLALAVCLLLMTESVLAHEINKV